MNLSLIKEALMNGRCYSSFYKDESAVLTLKQIDDALASLEWTDKEHQEAFSEGWCLSERSNGKYEIQRCDELEFWSNDIGPVLHCVAKALYEGSHTHHLALCLHGTKWPQ